MKKISMTLTGITPLLMHNPRLSDPLDEATKALAKLTSIRQKTEETHRQIAVTEFIGGLYWDEVNGVHLPAQNVFSCIVAGAKLSKGGAGFKRAVSFDPEHTAFPLSYDGPAEPEILAKDSAFVSRMSVKVGMQRVIRTRPKFSEWSVTAHLIVDDEILNPEQVQAYATKAGKYCGLGDFRDGGGFGRFDISDFIVEDMD